VRTTQNTHLSPTFWRNEKGRKEQQATFEGAKRRKTGRKTTENSQETPQLQQSHAITAM
jgi:hypothetical protein